MDRRELLKKIAILTGAVVTGSEVFLTGCKTNGKTTTEFSNVIIALLDEIAETILPATSTPGAKNAKAGEFMKRIVSDCYDEKEQKIFHEGIGQFQEACKREMRKNFMECTTQEKYDFLVSLDKDAKEHQNKKTLVDQQAGKLSMPVHYFTLIKQLTLWGYFTSKQGITQALHYVPVPGKYIACVDYKKGDKILAGLDG